MPESLELEPEPEICVAASQRCSHSFKNKEEDCVVESFENIVTFSSYSRILTKVRKTIDCLQRSNNGYIYKNQYIE